jgi:hypothetical protein
VTDLDPRFISVRPVAAGHICSGHGARGGALRAELRENCAAELWPIAERGAAFAFREAGPVNPGSLRQRYGLCRSAGSIDQELPARGLPIALRGGRVWWTRGSVWWVREVLTVCADSTTIFHPKLLRQAIVIASGPRWNTDAVGSPTGDADEACRELAIT